MGKALWTQLPQYKKSASVKKPKRIRARTNKRAAEERKYRARVKVWLKEPTKTQCHVAIILAMKNECPLITIPPSSQCHHSHGRVGKLLMYEPWWIPVSDWGHKWINDHPLKAREYGFICPIGRWNDGTIPTKS